MRYLRILAILMVSCVFADAVEKRPPNVVIIFLDDAGYADFKPFGDPPYPTPHVELLASQGVRLTQFYVPQAVCSSSRSSLLTGCVPGRHKVFGAHGPGARGLDPKFETMAEMLKRHGYATAHYGKWHCGDQPETRPLARGFDEHAGLMYSNDMWRHNPTSGKRWEKFPLHYWENGKVKIEETGPEDQKNLTKWSTDYAVDFIKRHKQHPFFLYLAHSMPHVPLYCSDEFAGKSGVGLFGDVMMEIDGSVGQVMAALDDAGVADETVVIFSSDNGPWSEYGNHAGVTPFREHKGTSFDGGIRSATVIRYPGKLAAGTVMKRALCSIDLLPTLAHLTGATLPVNPVDGRNVWPLISGQEGALNPHDYYPLSIGKHFDGIVSGDGRWKLHVPHSYRHVLKTGNDGARGKVDYPTIGLSLFDLENDPKESTNVIDQFPEVAERLRAFADAHRNEFYPQQKP